MRWTMTMMTRRRTLTRTHAAELEMGEARDMVTEAGEGRARGGTGGSNMHIIT
jgi:hypothetical protein